MSRDWVLEAVAGLSPMLELDDQVRPTVVAMLREASTLKDVEAGRWLFREGEAESDDGYVLLTGSVQVETSNGFSTQVFAPELLGEMKQFHIAGTSRRTADVRAVEPLEPTAAWDGGKRRAPAVHGPVPHWLGATSPSDRANAS